MVHKDSSRTSTLGFRLYALFDLAFDRYVEVQLLADGLPEDGVSGKTKALRGQDVVWEERGTLGIGTSDPAEIVLKAPRIVPAASFVRYV
jgi:hypothetical protein